MKIKNLILSIISLLFSINSLLAQDKYEPSIVVLAPNEVLVEDFLKEEVKKINDKITQRASALKSKPKPDMKGKPENIRIMVEKSIEVQLESDFSLIPTNTLADYLSYRFFEKFQNCLIYPLNLKTGNEATQLFAFAGVFSPANKTIKNAFANYQTILYIAYLCYYSPLTTKPHQQTTP